MHRITAVCTDAMYAQDMASNPRQGPGLIPLNWRPCFPEPQHKVTLNLINSQHTAMLPVKPSTRVPAYFLLLSPVALASATLNPDVKSHSIMSLQSALPLSKHKHAVTLDIPPVFQVLIGFFTRFFKCSLERSLQGSLQVL